MLRATPADLIEFFAAFDLDIVYHHEERRIDLSVGLSEDLADILDGTGDARGQRSRPIAGAGFEPATFGL